MAKAQINPFGENLLTEEAAEAEEIGTPEVQETVEAAPEPAQGKPEQKPEPVAEENEQQPATVSGEKYGNVLQALRAERERAKTFEKQVAELTPIKEQWARLEERQKVIREANEQAQRADAARKQAAERPDPSIDPFGAELYDLKQQRAADQAALAQLQQQLSGLGQNVQQTQQSAEFNGWVQNTAQEFSRQDPEYIDKATYAANKRMEFWRQIGPLMPAGMENEMIKAESVLVARIAKEYGGNFAPVIASLAQAWGYQSPNRQQQAVPAQNGAAQARLQQVAAGQRVQGISRIPSGGPAQPTVIRQMGPVELEAMSQAEFERIKHNPQLLRELAAAYAAADGVDPEDMMNMLKSA